MLRGHLQKFRMVSCVFFFCVFLFPGFLRLFSFFHGSSIFYFFQFLDFFIFSCLFFSVFLLFSFNVSHFFLILFFLLVFFFFLFLFMFFLFLFVSFFQSSGRTQKPENIVAKFLL